MKTIFILFGIFLGLTLTGNSQDYYLPISEKSTRAEVLQKSHSNLSLHLNVKGLSGKSVEHKDAGIFTEFYMGMGYSVGDIGSPKIPAFKKLIQVPFGAELEVEIMAFSKQDVSLNKLGISNPIIPVQPSPRKDRELHEQQFVYNKKSYQKEGLISSPLVKVEILGTMRGVRIARVEVAAMDYDPVNETIRVFSSIEVDINFKNVDKLKNERITKQTYSPYFESIYGQLANYSTKDAHADHPDLTKHPVRMLVVSHRMFEQSLQPFIQWKTKKGYSIEVGYTDEIGQTPNSIKNWIQNAYNNSTEENPAPSFLVIVGDVQQVPASATGSFSNKKTDLYYASVDGDYFPEMYYGRLSAQTTQQLDNIISKILYYEQYQFEDPSYLNNATLIAGSDATWNTRVGEPTIKYGTQYTFNNEKGFQTVWGYGVSNDPNNPNNSPGYTGCYENERIAVSLINYTAHCNQTSWSGPNLFISNINSMTNTNMYPLAIGNCCLSADFGYLESIGEAWIRAENRGAVTYIGSSPNSYWFEDFYWAVGAFPLQGNNNGYVPTFEETTLGVYDAPFHSDYLTTGGLVFAGNLAVTEAHLQGYPDHSSTHYYWEAYNVLGDPSLVAYLTEAENNNVNHFDNFPIGVDSYTVSALPKSYVAISKDGVLLGVALVGDTGEVEVPVQPVSDEGDIDIVVTRPQTKPYIVQVPAQAVEGPFLVLDGFDINDENGNNNGEADFGETFSLDVTLKNIGTTQGNDITATLVGDDDFFNITDFGPASFGDIENDENSNTASASNAFALKLNNKVPDQHQATFTVQIQDNQQTTWESNLTLVANAPVLSIGSMVIDNGNSETTGILNPGETVNIIIEVANEGHATAGAISASLSTESGYIDIVSDPIVSLGSIDPDETVQAVFTLSSSPDTPLETIISLQFEVEAEEYSSEKEFEIVIGQVPEFIMGEHDEVISCKGVFYDSGGPNSNYLNNENLTMTFYPTAEDKVLLFDFHSFSLESGYDFLYIFNGDNDSATQFPGSPFTGSNSPGIIMASNPKGALTYRFESDHSITASGWEASFECVEKNAPPPCTTNPIPEDGDVINQSILTLAWEPINVAFEYDLYFGKDNLSQEPLATLTANNYSVQLEENSNYYWKVVPKNESGSAEGCPVWSFSTGSFPDEVQMHNGTITTCNAVFYDSGGPDGNYSNYETYTLSFYPETESSILIVDFTHFDIEEDYDFLYVYDGEDTFATQIDGSPFTGTEIPNLIIPTNEAGAITFHFTSDHSITATGWAANIYCEDLASYDAEILSFDFEEDVVIDLTIFPVEDNEATINITVASGTDITALTPTITISQGATINPTPGVPMDFSEPVSFVVTSSNLQTVITYAVSVIENVSTSTVTFSVNNSDESSIEGAEISIDSHEPITTNSNGEAIIQLEDGEYTFIVNVENYNEFEDSFTVSGEDISISVNLTPLSVTNQQLINASIYPNPFGDYIVVSGSKDVHKVLITNILGQKVLYITASGQEEISIPTSHLTQGVYMVSLYSQTNEMRVFKLIKK